MSMWAEQSSNVPLGEAVQPSKGAGPRWGLRVLRLYVFLSRAACAGELKIAERAAAATEISRIRMRVVGPVFKDSPPPANSSQSGNLPQVRQLSIVVTRRESRRLDFWP